MLIKPRVLNSLPFISESLASLSPLQLTNITFVSFVSAELNNKFLGVIIWVDLIPNAAVEISP